CVTRPRKHKQFAPFVQCNLRDQMRSIAKPVNAEPTRISRFPIGAVTDQAGAKQRRYLNIIVTVRQMKTVSRIGNREVGVTAIDGVTGETRVIAEILPA